jgi:iron complex outermembrane receptor protein
MKRLAATLLCSAVLMIMQNAGAQTQTGEFTGFVMGPKSTGLAGAMVTIRRLDNGAIISVVAGARGAYRASDLAAGKYELKAVLAGFDVRTVPEVVLDGSETKTIDFNLPVAGISEIITVIGETTRDSLEAAEARESSARDVGEALAQTSGVWKLRKGGIASDIVLRGFQSKDMNVLIDGQRIYGACPNHMDPPAFHADFGEVERIELGKGPFDVKNQGSLGGVINIVTRRPARGLHVDADLSTGSFGYLNPSTAVSYGTQSFSFLAGYSFRRSLPYVDGDGKRFTQYVNYRTELTDSDSFRVGTAWGKFSVKPASNHLLQISYTRQQADHVLYPYLQMDAVYDDTDRAGLAYQIDGLQGFVKALRFHGYFTQVHHWMTDQYRTSSVGVARAYGMGTMAHSDAFGGRLEADLRGITVGAEAFRRGWNTTTAMAASGYQTQYSIPDVKTDSIGVYAEYRRQLSERMQLNAGARIDVARSEADPVKANTNLYFAYNSTRSTSASNTVPSGNVRLSYRMPSGFEVSLGVGHTARLPEPQERYVALKRMGSDWVGNPGLTPSRNTGFDGTMSFRHHGLYLGSSLYFNQVNDFITVNRTPKTNVVPGVMNSFARSYQNVDAKLYGFDAEAVYSLTQRVYLSGNTSFVRGVQDSIPTKGINSENLPEMPPLRSRAGLRYATARLSVEIEGVFSGPQRWVNTDLREDPTAGYGIANLKFCATFRRFTFRASFNNILNRLYYEYLSYQRDPFRTGTRVYEPGRNLYFNLSFRY